MSKDALITDFQIEERIDLDGLPMTMAEAIDKDGKVHPKLLEKLPMAREVRIAIDQVRVARHMTRGELEGLFKELR